MKTRREGRKNRSAPNAAVQASIRDGDDVLVGATAYRGCPPRYIGRISNDGSMKYTKVAKGVPFVRMTRRDFETKTQRGIRT